MKKPLLEFTQFKKQALADRQLQAEYDRLQPEFAVIEAVLRARKDQGLSQAKLAQKLGTKQTAISRLETGKANPSLAFLKKVAQALDTHLEIRFTRLQ